MPVHITRHLGHEKHDVSPKIGPNLSGLDLEGANLRNQDFQGADFRHANLRLADLRGSDLFGARFDGANLRGCRWEMTQVVEIWIPSNLPHEIANQIRAFDFNFVMTRIVGPNRDSQHLACPYKNAAMRPLLYEWGSRTWHAGRNWAPPSCHWTLEEIIASVLDFMGCSSDLVLPFRVPQEHALEVSW